MALQYAVNRQLAWCCIEVLHVLAHKNMPELYNVIIPTSCQQVAVIQYTILIYKRRNKLENYIFYPKD
jgi:intergrase/recombinase